MKESKKMKKENAAGKRKIKLENYLKEKSLPGIEQIKNYYFYLIDKILELYIDEKEIIDKIIDEVISVQIIKKIKKINTTEELQKMLFDETMTAASPYCMLEDFSKLKWMMYYLQDIYVQIETLPRNYIPVIKMRFEGKKLTEIEQELGLTKDQIVSINTAAANLLTEGLENRNKLQAAHLFETTVYELIFVKDKN